MTWWLTVTTFAVILAALVYPRRQTPRRFGLESEAGGEAACAYDRLGNGWFFRGERYLMLTELRRLQPHGCLLDVGCGPGRLAQAISRLFPGVRVMALDNNPDMLYLAGRHLQGLNICLVAAAVEAMPFPGESLDIVVSSGSLHHWRDAGLALSEIYRVLKPDGQLLIMDLRRDIRRFMYVLVWFFHLMMPTVVKDTNGAWGSLHASYTPEEAGGLLRSSAFAAWRVRPGPAWFFIIARK